MINYFNLTILVITISTIFIPTAFAESLDSFENNEVVKVILADQILFDQLNDQLSDYDDYDNIATLELSEDEASALLEHNSQYLSYSQIAKDDLLSITRGFCLSGAVGMPLLIFTTDRTAIFMQEALKLAKLPIPNVYLYPAIALLSAGTGCGVLTGLATVILLAAELFVNVKL